MKGITVKDIIRMYYHPLPSLPPELWYDHEAIEEEIHDLRYQIARKVLGEFYAPHPTSIDEAEWLDEQEKK